MTPHFLPIWAIFASIVEVFSRRLTSRRYGLFFRFHLLQREKTPDLTQNLKIF
jgi:hypothetical protein